MEEKFNLDQKLHRSVQHFWSTRDFQSQRAAHDQGFRSAVTGGKQMDGFVEIVRDVVVECGISDSEIHYKSRLELPGYFRPEKKWDILVVAENTLVVAAEFKSQSSSFGNNFNMVYPQFSGVTVGQAAKLTGAAKAMLECSRCRL